MRGPFPDPLSIARALTSRLVMESLLPRQPLDDRLRVRELCLPDLEAARQKVRVLVRVRAGAGTRARTGQGAASRSPGAGGRIVRLGVASRVVAVG